MVTFLKRFSLTEEPTRNYDELLRLSSCSPEEGGQIFPFELPVPKNQARGWAKAISRKDALRPQFELPARIQRGLRNLGLSSASWHQKSHEALIFPGTLQRTIGAPQALNEYPERNLAQRGPGLFLATSGIF
ncbi:hypothetical protein GWK47_001814 [Chionoecetes opilio]|uniref:Uncharacterized protein n=1 Tax=Chionoecetes opilio TaxID=41210 RepID=A0A8J5CJV9_CHIOP|nr:hypothetical protein GWK47_001814 [Chionoecetes opilio]